MISTDFEPLGSLLRRHGLADVAEEPFPNDGWSGASMTLLRRGGGDRFVLKRDSLARDWIARATDDGPVLREAWFAAHGPELPAGVRAPYLGVGRDGDEFALLMPDLTETLFDWDQPISVDELDKVLVGIADLHARWWMAEEPPAGPWCPLMERLTLICRASLERAGPARDAVAERILPGWDAFDRRAPGEVRDLINGLGEDPAPLLAALGRLPATLLHGDLKLANVGIAADRAIELVDWQMVLVAPVAVELGWFLVSNVASLPLPPDDVLERYASKLAYAISDDQSSVDDDFAIDAFDAFDEASFDAAILVGLLLRGWRKGADAEAAVIHASGVAASDDLRWWSERALAAAARIL